MNNYELVSHIDKLRAASRFSGDRKARLTELIGNRYSVCGEVYRVNNTTGYVRKLGLRKGKTITLHLAGCKTEICIRCNYDRATSIMERDETAEFSIEIIVTGYDEVRQRLQADESDIDSSSSGSETAISSNPTNTVEHTHPSSRDDIDQVVTPASPVDDGDQLLDEILKMQISSQNFLSEAADDITKAQSSNAALVGPDMDTAAFLDTMTDGTRDSVKAVVAHDNSEHQGPIQREAIHNFVDKQLLMQQQGAVDFQGKDAPPSQVATEKAVSKSPLSVLSKKPQQSPNSPRSPDGVAITRTPKRLSRTQASEFDRLQREILNDQTSPVESKVFCELIALKTSVPVSQVRNIQTQLWHAVISPAMFEQQRTSFKFFPFGEFNLLKNREFVDLEFKSAPVRRLAKHDVVEQYPYSNFDTGVDNSIHPPIATQAVRIASTVAPLVGLSPPVTYDVIFETLLLLLKIFGVGKRRIRFTDVGEFFPVVLRGTLQYHFRPYRPLLRFATESFRSILSLAEREGEGQLSFEKDKGVPDRSRIKRTSLDKSSGSRKSSMKIPKLWTIAIVGFIAYQLIKNFVS